MPGGVRVRFLFFRALLLCALGTVILRLWDLQVLSAERYQAFADTNRFRLVEVDAPRGIIYDRYGRRLVRNVPSFTVSVVPAGLPDEDDARKDVLRRLSELFSATNGGAPSAVEETAARIDALLRERTTGPYAVSVYSPIRVASNIDRQAAFVIEEEHLELPGVVVAAEPLRHYLDGALTSHILGYVGAIPAESLSSYADEGYASDDLVGLTGIELTQEAHLAGIKGSKHIEVDAFERQVDTIAMEPPVEGSSVVLTLDLGLQRVAEQALRDGMRKAESKVGVVACMDPRTGEVLSLVSLPSYDNNLFSGGISSADYAALSSDRHLPLVNHAISGQYPPGSTFKIVPAFAALYEGVVDARTSFTCRGILYLPNKHFPDDPTMAQPFYCWHETGHGPQTLVDALRNSCDIYFYQVAGGYGDFEGLGIERLAEYAGLFGFGAPTGIDLSGEVAGLLPSDRWKRQYYGETWYTGDTYNAAIGQGYVLATPLQVLNATAAIANGGSLYRPQLVYQVIDDQGRVVQALEPELLRELPVDDESIGLVQQGMHEVVSFGTGWLARLPGIAVAGKTGTAEYPGLDENGELMLDDEGYLPTHAWFTAYAPADDPEIALVVFLEGGGEGSQTAAPVAAEVLRYYFDLTEPGPLPPAIGEVGSGDASENAN